MYIKKLSEVSSPDVDEVGGKGASLGELIKAGISVPPGFIVTTKAYKQFKDQKLSVEVRDKIYKAFEALGAKRVAVRSSAVAEDSSTSSWAGQLETYLNVTRENLIENILKCWNSIKSEKALSYAAQQKINEDQLSVAVVVQKMVDSEVSGVMFTVNPINKNTNKIMIEAGFGLGEMVVQGKIIPNNFIVDKKTLEIKNKNIQTQETMLICKDGQNQEISVSDEKKDQSALSDAQIKELSSLGKKIENYFGKPQDVEWALENGKFYILQSRPITA